MSELGVQMKEGTLRFEPGLLLRSEVLNKDVNATFITVNGTVKNILLQPGSLAFTICQVPVVYQLAASPMIEVFYNNGAKESLHSNELNSTISQQVLHRTGEIDYLLVYINENSLR
jgi:hypothetical protein